MIKPTRTFDILKYHKEHFNNDDILAKKVNGEWVKYATDDYIEIVNNLSYGFLSLGLQKGDKVAIIANNCPEWNFIDMALAQIQVISVPMYPTISKEDYQYIFNDAEVKMVFAGDKKILDKINEIKEHVPSLSNIFTIFEIESEVFWTKVTDIGKNNPNQELVEKSKEEVNPMDLFTIIYTSGTTGQPKGVMLSHNNVVSNAIAASKSLPIPAKVKTVSFLPLCHIFERTNLLYINMLEPLPIMQKV